MIDPELRGQWREIGDRLKRDPHDMAAWLDALKIGRFEYKPSGEPGKLGKYMLVLDEGQS